DTLWSIQVMGRQTPGALARYRHLRSIATKQTNVALNPLQGKSLISNAGVDYTVSIDFIRGQEAKSTQLSTRSARRLECFSNRKYTDAVLNSYSDEAIVVAADDHGEILVSLTLAVTAAIY
ncbi:MAG: hypothetical protein Q9183_006906, partial [Haloplaca sp. 2 TL-2023]